MTFDQREQSANDGSPQRLFLFTAGATRRWTYVNAALPAVYLNESYAPLSIDMDDIEQALAESSPTLQITLDSRSGVVEQFIPYMPVEPVKVRVYRHHVGDPTDEYKTELIGEVANAAIREGEDVAVLTVRMIASALDRKVPWPIYQKQCNHVLYGPGCRVNRENFKTETLVTGVVGNTITSSDFVKTDPNWFRAGYVVRVSTGESRWVVAQSGPTLTLQTPFLGLRESEAVVAFAGCDLLFATCRYKFNNLPRFLGFQWVPTKNPFRDSVFGTGSPAGGG